MILLRLVIENTEAPHSISGTGIGAILTGFISPIFGNDDFIDLFQDIHFQRMVFFGGCGQTWRSIDFYEPGFAGVVQKNIKAIKLKAVFVIDDDALYAFKWHYDEVIDLFKALVGFFSSMDHL